MFRGKKMTMGLAFAAAALFVVPAFAASEPRAGGAYLDAAIEEAPAADRFDRDIRAGDQVARASGCSCRSGRSSSHSSHSGHSSHGGRSHGGRRSRSSQNVTLLAMSLEGAHDRRGE